MSKVEKGLLDWADRNLLLLIGIMGTLFSLLVRYAFKDIVSADYRNFLEGWYNEIYSGGGIKSLGRQVGNYNFLYQFCIAVMTYFPVRPLYAYKILSVFFDYGLAVIAAVTVAMISDNCKKKNALTAYFAVLFSPVVILNSAAWAQCDAIYVFWVFCALYALLREKYFVAFVLLGMAFSFKLQAVFILPFFLFAYFVFRKFSVVHFMVIPATMILTGIPTLFAGRSFLEIFRIYFEQTDRYKQVALNYPSFWTLFFEAGSTEYYSAQKPAALILTVIILAALMTWWIQNGVEPSNKNMICMAFLLSYTCVLFLPQMHDRYGYLYEILAIVVLFADKSTAKLIIPLYMLTFTTYGKFLFKLPHPVDVNTGIVNTLVWSAYTVVILKGMRQGHP